jgi:hypothetical protein
MKRDARTQIDWYRCASLLPPSANASIPNLLGCPNPRLKKGYLCVTTGVQVGALSEGAEPKIPGIISDEQSKIRPFSVVAR